MSKTGIIYGVNGPVIYLKGDPGFKISEMVYVGPEKLVGEVIGLKKGMTIAIEPMINMGQRYVKFLSDGWGVATKDGMPSAHYENTVLITADGAEILTL